MIDKTICCIDGGLFQSWVHRLALDYKRVLYFRPWTSSFSNPGDLEIGDGYGDIERIGTFWDKLDEIDTFFFPDIHFPDWQTYLRSIGKPVWGAGRGEDLELMRAETKEYIEANGVKLNPWAVVYGMDKLREYLQDHGDVFVKVSVVRGLTETFYSKNFDLIEPKLGEIEHKLGGLSGVQEFIIESSIPDAREIGYDGWSIDGKYCKTALYGVEVKDKGYLGRVVPYADTPKSCQIINKAVSPFMEENVYRGFWSTEIREKNGNPFPIDFTCRAASPAGECLQELVGNLGEIIEAGARGEVEEPKWAARFAAQAILESKFADKNWLPIHIPPKIRHSVKLYHSCIVEGVEYIVPINEDMPEIGSVLATGSSPDDAIKKCKAMCDQIEAYQLKCHVDSLEEAKTELMKP